MYVPSRVICSTIRGNKWKFHKYPIRPCVLRSFLLVHTLFQKYVEINRSQIEHKDRQNILPLVLATPTYTHTTLEPLSIYLVRWVKSYFASQPSSYVPTRKDDSSLDYRKGLEIIETKKSNCSSLGRRPADHGQRSLSLLPFSPYRGVATIGVFVVVFLVVLFFPGK